MHLEVRDGLSGHRTHFDTDVVASRLAALLKERLARVDQFEQGGPFGSRGLEVRGKRVAAGGPAGGPGSRGTCRRGHRRAHSRSRIAPDTATDRRINPRQTVAGLDADPQAVRFQARSCRTTLNCSSGAGGSKYDVTSSKSASVVHFAPGASFSSRLRCFSWRLHRSSDATMKWSS